MTEAEYQAYLDTCYELLWVMQLLHQIDVLQESPIQVFTDSQSGRALAHSLAFHGRPKHIEVHYHFVRELVKSQVINLAYCPTQENVAELFTKPPSRQAIDQLLGRLNVGLSEVLESGSSRHPLSFIFILSSSFSLENMSFFLLSHHSLNASSLSQFSKIFPLIPHLLYRLGSTRVT